MEGFLHSFESLAAVDGEGLRVAAFLAGCPLRCVFCHNPDTWQQGEKRIGAASLAQKISRYQPYFGANGGVTFSGGEPLLQAEFLLEVISHLKQMKIGYVVDTSGFVPLTPAVKEVLSGAQQVLLDLKFWDDASYRAYTGVSIAPTLETLSFLESIGKSTRIRTVVIPGLNDSVAILSRYLPLVKGIGCIKSYELLPFHTMGFFKYEELGVSNPLKSTPALEPAVKDRLQAFMDQNLAI